MINESLLPSGRLRRLPGSRRAMFIVATLAVAAAIGVAACGGSSSTAVTEGEGNPAEANADEEKQTKPAPDFELVLFHGQDVIGAENLKLSDLAGTPVVVNFWFPSCPPCRAEMPELEAAFKKFEDQGVLFVGVELLSLDTEEDGKEFIKEVGVTYPNGADRDASITIDYSVTGFPTTFFITRDQQIARKWTGPITPDKLEEFIGELLQ